MASAGLHTPMGQGFGVHGHGHGRYLGQGQWQLNGNGNSPPDVGYYRSQTQTHQSQPQQSRWKEDWEELELLVRFVLFDFYPSCAWADLFYSVGKRRVRICCQG
jgi:hypothetical protein